MELKALYDYEQYLYGCRFCPMCKPASEVGNLTQQEGHSTRGRALMLWRVAKGMSEIGIRDAELIFQSTLDSISEAWCISHYPVSGYVAAARRELVAKGNVPDTVKATLERQLLRTPCPKSHTVFLAGEASELCDQTILKTALTLLNAAGEKVSEFVAPTGTLAYALGDLETARKQAEDLVKSLTNSGVKRIITDSITTLYALKVLYTLLSVPFPEGLDVLPLVEVTEKALAANRIENSLGDRKKVFFQDSRSAYYLAEELASDYILQPYFSNTEQYSGSGEVYERPRRILKSIGLEVVSSVWSRSLSRSTGADDGLWITYPKLAIGLAVTRLEHAHALGADIMVTDSLLDAMQLRAAAAERDQSAIQVCWLPEVFVPSEQELT